MRHIAENWCQQQELCDNTNLGIPREKMPQINKQHLLKFIAWLVDRGIPVRHAVYPVDTLKATQHNIDTGKVHSVIQDGVADILDSHPMLVSSDGYVLDGHHRWAALIELSPKTTIAVNEIGLPIRTLLHIVRSFPYVKYQEDSVSQRTATFPITALTRRDIYLPKDMRGTPPNVDSKGADVSIWTWEDKGKYVVLAFTGRQSKPAEYKWFSSESARDNLVNSLISTGLETAKRKQDRRDERKQFQHSVQVGDIYNTNWGYEQTNIEFYEVVKTLDKSLVVRQVASKTVGSGQTYDYVVPDKGNYIGPPIMVRATQSGFKVDTHYAAPWNGKAQHETNSAFGH